MVGDSSGRGEPLPSVGIEGRGSRKRSASGGNNSTHVGDGAADPRDNVRRAFDTGLLNAAQSQTLQDLLSRMSILDFESRRIISVIVSNIALEESVGKRRELAVQLQEYLEEDGLAKDLAVALNRAFLQD